LTPVGSRHSGLVLTERESEILEVMAELKAQSGSHAPSLFSLGDRLPDVDLKVDACFLSNPYATDLFIERLTSDLLDTGDLRKVLESYPSPNNQIAMHLENAIGVDHSNIFVANGAVEVIQAALHRFAGTRVAVILPTFSPYYEYLLPNQECFFYRLSRDDDFALDPDDFIKFVRDNRIDTVCLINPNNPNGGYVPADDMLNLLDALAELELVILDESFVDFAYEDDLLNRSSLAEQVVAKPNVVLVKSMSKDFGIAGLRAGYAVMSPERVRALVSNGFLWNISGLAEFFFRLFSEADFQDSYVATRLRYLDEAISFFGKLKDVPGIRTYSTKANFCLVELDSTIRIDLFVPLLLIRHGVYVRDCRDKIGLDDGQFVRIASRKGFENELILDALTDLTQQCLATG
jgi:histidinol-phosphate/aromatic aminotransferase/cobyric acid decarboxylase-like protein